MKNNLEVLEAIELFSQAYREADTNTLSDMLTDQYIHSNNGGPILRKDTWLNWINSRRKSIEDGSLIISEYFNENVVIKTYDDTAVVHGLNISKGVFKGQSFSKKIAFTHTWIKENGKWKRASFHDSKVD